MCNQNTTDKEKKQYGVKVSRCNYKPKLYDFGKVRYEGDRYVTVVQQLKRVQTHVKRLDKHTYIVLKTGEIKEYNKMDTAMKRASKRATLNRTFDELKALIRTNFVSQDHAMKNSQLFVTLTYGENMRDHKQLYNDWVLFWQKLKYFKKRFNLEYICVMEPQGRGAWHVHAMIKTTSHKWLWIEKEKISELWGHGYAETKRLKSDDVGAYYTAYFTNLVKECRQGENVQTSEDIYSQEQSFFEKAEEIKDNKKYLSKMVEKGSRLSYYPKGFRFYRCSKGIERPKVHKSEMLYDLTIEDGYEEVFSKSFEIAKVFENGEKEVLNKIYKGTYKKLS